MGIETEPQRKSLKKADTTDDIVYDNGHIDLYRIYKRDGAMEVPLLTAQEEVNLAKSIERGRAAQQFLDMDPSLESADRERLARIAQEGDSAREHFTLANTRYVVNKAKKYSGQGVPFPDLIQEGNLAVMTCVLKFDWRLGNRFSTFVTPALERKMEGAIADQKRTIRLPRNMQELIVKFNRIQRDLPQTLKRTPTKKELAGAMGWTEEKFDTFLKQIQEQTSLDAPTGEDGNSSLNEIIPSEPDAEVDHTFHGQMRQDVLKAIETIPNVRDREILKARFGIDGTGETLTYAQLSEHFGVTRDRVQKLEKRAIRWLRNPKRSVRLKRYYDEVG